VEPLTPEKASVDEVIRPIERIPAPGPMPVIQRHPNLSQNGRPLIAIGDASGRRVIIWGDARLLR
jgi:hypothetical protein